jgi:glutamyl-tRNA synthetase
VEDAVYVEKVLDAELARTVILNDIPSSSIFFFLEPQYDSHESSSMLKSFDRRTMQAYGREPLMDRGTMLIYQSLLSKVSSRLSD